MRTTDGPAVQSVGRAIRILEHLADEAGELTLSELGRRLGVHRATASRLVSTLAEHGLVERSAATDRYRLGFGLVRLAGAAVARLDLVQQSRPVLEGIAERTGETVNLAVLSGGQVMHVDQVSGSRSVVSASWVGRVVPFHCTSNGKVLVAFLAEGDRERMLDRPLERSTRNTIVDPETLRAELQEVRARGYAKTVEELEEGLNAVAAPVRQADGAVVAAVSISGPSFRMRPAALPRLAHLAVDAGTAISQRMGYMERRQSVGH